MVNVGQNWRLDCNKSRHSAAELVPGRSIDTVSFCGWAPCHAEAALCENTSFFLLYAAWVRSRAERPSVSYTKVVSNVAWTGHNLQFTKTN